jgi:hypothetical protein
VASRLDSAARELAVQILRCPILTQCLEEGGSQLPCAEVATGPGSPHRAHWVPEPWVGRLAEAPLLFVSSNPGGGSDPSTDPYDPSSSSSDEVLLDCQDGAFDEGQLPGIADGQYLVDVHGNRGKSVHYWEWVKRCASEILSRAPIPGQDYALTEVVHCGSPSADGVWKALQTCASRYLQPVLANSPASVLVVVGAIAKFAFAEYLKVVAPDHLVGPLELAERERLVVVVPHPNSRGGNVLLSRHLTDEQLALVRQALSR